MFHVCNGTLRAVHPCVQCLPSEAQIMILDDILSSVNQPAHVTLLSHAWYAAGKAILHCIMGHLGCQNSRTDGTRPYATVNSISLFFTMLDLTAVDECVTNAVATDCISEAR